MNTPKFELGQKVITLDALRKLCIPDVYESMEKHANGNWGDVPEEIATANNVAVSQLGQIISVYHDRQGAAFYIITEHDRSVTTVLLPEER